MPRVAEPPDLHWLLLLVLEFCTLGIFGTIWIFRQSRWAKQVDPTSKATVQLVAAVIVFVIAGFLTAIPEFQIWGALLQLGGVACFLLGSFSIKRVMESYYKLSLSGPMTFFFSLIYFQYHFNQLIKPGRD